MVIAATGHRPKKLYGYNLNTRRWLELREKFKWILLRYECTEAISGMALGTDMVFAQAVLDLKNLGRNIKLHCAIPHKDYANVWCKEDIRMYNDILNSADEVTYVCDGPFNNYMMKERNKYMVDNCDMLVAVWDGSENSGTGHTISYAKSKNKDTLFIDPKGIK